jgi:hypothetical protein
MRYALSGCRDEVLRDNVTTYGAGRQSRKDRTVDPEEPGQT